MYINRAQIRIRRKQNKIPNGKQESAFIKTISKKLSLKRNDTRSNTSQIVERRDIIEDKSEINQQSNNLIKNKENNRQNEDIGNSIKNDILNVK